MRTFTAKENRFIGQMVRVNVELEVKDRVHFKK